MENFSSDLETSSTVEYCKVVLNFDTLSMIQQLKVTDCYNVVAKLIIISIQYHDFYINNILFSTFTQYKCYSFIIVILLLL